MKKFLGYLNTKPKWLIIILGAVLIGLLGVIDHLTGDYSLTLFYLMPVFLSAWFVHKQAGLVMSLLSGFAIVIAHEVPYSGTYDPIFMNIWNTSMEVLFLIIMSYMFSMLKKDFEVEHSLSRQDQLTHAANRRSFTELAEYEINQSRRHQRALSLAYIDLDNFKSVNDSMGHHVGDTLLVKVVQTLQEHIRNVDIVSRLGGDEFCILFPETSSAATVEILEKLQNHLLTTMKMNSWPVTFSIGAITYNNPPASAEAMLKEVDARMYAAKRGGKNMISHATVESHSTPSSFTNH